MLSLLVQMMVEAEVKQKLRSKVIVASMMTTVCYYCIHLRDYYSFPLSPTTTMMMMLMMLLQRN